MTDVDRTTLDERRLRDEIRRALMPPPTPAGLQAAVEALAADPPSAGRGPAWWRNAGTRGLRAAAGAAAVVVVVVGALLVFQSRNGDRVAATPLPTLPAITQPALPSAAPSPTILDAGRWLDATTAWSLDAGRNVRITTDAGQHWSQPHPIPNDPDLGLDFHDATHGYTAWIGASGEQRDVTVSLTDDGGTTWRTIPLASIPGSAGDALGNVHFSDPDHGVMLVTTWTGGPIRSLDACLGWSTADRGATWSSIIGAPCFDVGGPQWGDASTGIVARERGATVALTRDGGRTWINGTLPEGIAGASFRWLAIPRDGAIVRLVGAALPEGVLRPFPLVVLAPAADGTAWTVVDQPAGMNANTIMALDPLDLQHWLALVVTEDGGTTSLVETFDGGRSWSTFADTGLMTGSLLDFADRLHGTVQGLRLEGACGSEPGCSGTGTMWFTNDGGQSWHQVPF